MWSKCSAKMDKYIKGLPKVSGSNAQPYLSRRLNEVILRGEKIMGEFGDEYMGTEHLYLAIIEEKKGFSGELLKEYGITKDKFLQELKKSAKIRELPLKRRRILITCWKNTAVT